uniref:Methyltransferase n=1 Tax=viral metagenome TaxID=1070528 RepID=A0A6C0I119_9ZZZZ
MEMIWRDSVLYEKGSNLLFHFLIKKLRFSAIDEIKEIIESDDSLQNQLRMLKAIYSPKQKKYSPQSLELRHKLSQFMVETPWFNNNCDEYSGWTVFDARDLELLINYMDEIPSLNSAFTFKFSTMLEITPKLLFNIKRSILASSKQFLTKEISFIYVNIGDVGGDLFRGIVQLLELPANSTFNLKSQELDAMPFSKLKKRSASLITIFMTVCHFGVNINQKFKKLYNLSTKGGYLLIQDHDLPPYQRDKAHLYETFYNLYRILYNEISIADFMAIYKHEATNYMTRYELIECVSNAGYTPIGINILNDTDGYYNRVIILFQKK